LLNKTILTAFYHDNSRRVRRSYVRVTTFYHGTRA